MIAAPGLQVGFGDPLDPALLQELRVRGFTIIRLDLQQCDLDQTEALARQVIDAGLQPLCIIRRAEQMTVLPTGALMELGNEPNLEHEGWSVEEYLAVAAECIEIACLFSLRLYLGAVSNLDPRGFNFLRQLPWDTYPSNICCSVHRYPVENDPLQPHAGSSSREHEVRTLRDIVGNRPLACTEVGYHDDVTGGTESAVALNMRWEGDFFSEHGFEVCVGYQVNDGPGTEPIDHFGFRRLDGSWKPVADFFVHGRLPKAEGPEITLQASGWFYVCAESGGGSYVPVDRPEAGPWETWVVVSNDDGTVSLQSHNGFYLSAKSDGSCLADRAAIGEEERFELEVRDGTICAFKTAHGTWLQAQQGGGLGMQLVQALSDTTPGEWEFFTPSKPFWASDPPVVARPLVGPLRVEAKLFRDDTGPRRGFFCSWFTALRILHDDPDEFYRQLDSIVAAGYQGFRVFLTVGGWMQFWDGREVAPMEFQKWHWTGNFLRTDRYGDTIAAWPDYDDLLRTLLRECRVRKLRLHVTAGDLQIICPRPNDELDLARRWARICAEEGGLEVISFVDVTNEFPINRFGSESSASIAQMGKVVDIWTAALPGVLIGQGAILSEEPAALEKSVTHGNICITHTTRDPFELCLKRTFGLVYWEGDYRAFKVPFLQGEPAGPGEESYARQDSPANLVALYALHALTGQWSNRFQGAAVRSFEPLESEWGFFELPALFDQLLPEDIALWQHGSNGRGGIEYWWRDREFRTVVFSEWDPTPPRPVASWTLYTGTSIHTGTGTLPRGTKRMRGAQRATGLLVGTFV